MNLDIISTGLKWTFWVLLYLAIALTAMVLCLGMLAPYLDLWLRWAALGVFVGGIAVDVHVKTRPRGTGGPSGGEPVHVTRQR